MHTKIAPSKENPLHYLNSKRCRSIWLQRLCEYWKLSNILTEVCRVSPENFCKEYLRLHRTFWHIDFMKGPTNFLRKVRISRESFSWFSYIVASMSDFHSNVSSWVFLFVDGPTWNWLPMAKQIGEGISLLPLKTQQRQKITSLPFSMHWAPCLRRSLMEMSTLWGRALSLRFCHLHLGLSWGIWRSQWTLTRCSYPTGSIMCGT